MQGGYVHATNVTIAPVIPGSTFMEATVLGHMTVGGSLFVLDKRINYNNIFDNHSILEKKDSNISGF